MPRRSWTVLGLEKGPKLGGLMQMVHPDQE